MAMYDEAGKLIQQHHLVMPAFFAGLWKIYEANGHQTEAYHYLKLYYEQSDSLNALAEAKRQQVIKTKNDFENKLSEIVLLKKENQLKEQQLKTQQVRFTAILAILGLTIVTVFMLYRNNMQRKRMNDDLEERIKERTRELMTTNKELDTFLYRSSHDIRRPITTLMGLDYLGKQIDADEAVREILDKVGTTARNMDGMLKKLQAVHEVNRNLYPEKTKCSVFVLMKEVVREFDGSTGKFEINFDAEILRGLSIDTDPSLFKIILFNLLENSVQHRIPGRMVRIRLLAGFRENVFYIEITDDGRGIDEEVATKVYEPFFKGNDQSNGSGLGLYLVKKSVERLRGNIELKSVFGVGTTITVQLPMYIRTVS